MTVEQRKLLTTLEDKVRQLLALYRKTREEKEELARKLEETASRLSGTEKIVREWETKYEHLKLAKILTVSEQEAKQTQHNLSKLEREIEKCIALLNE